MVNTTKPAGVEFINAASCAGPVAGGATTFWREEIAHNGIAPLVSDTTYLVFRSAVQWGADPTGVNDSASNINDAITGKPFSNTITLMERTISHTT